MPERFGDDPKPDPQVFVRGQDGELRNVFEILKLERLTGESRMGTQLLKGGDVIAMQVEKDSNQESELLFSVEGTEWEDLGVAGNNGPSSVLQGELSGPARPQTLDGEKVIFMGSGFGGSMLEPGVLVTSRYPRFYTKDGEYQAPLLSNFKVLRPSGKEQELELIDEEQITAEALKDEKAHSVRLQRAQVLMRKFGFDKYDFIDGTVDSHLYETYEQLLAINNELTYEDDLYLAQYQAGMAMGNQLVVFNKQTNLWMELKYFNYKNEDILQVGFVNLAEQNLDDLFLSGAANITDESGIHRSRQPIATFTTSIRSGLAAINYKPSEREATEALAIPIETWGVARPNIQFFADGRVHVPLSYPFSETENQNPGLADSITNKCSTTYFEDGKPSLVLNDHTIELNDPDAEIETLLSHH